MADNRPNPLTHAAESSHLPREMRARIGQSTDPLPEGKVAHTEPEHHFTIDPAGHDVERTNPKTAAELGHDPHEFDQLQRQSRERVDNRSADKGAVFSSSVNKDMPSTHQRPVAN
jgi:hypothetical protein